MIGSVRERASMRETIHPRATTPASVIQSPTNVRCDRASAVRSMNFAAVQAVFDGPEILAEEIGKSEPFTRPHIRQRLVAGPCWMSAISSCFERNRSFSCRSIGSSCPESLTACHQRRGIGQCRVHPRFRFG